MNIELTRFRVKEGKSQKVDEWMKFLNDNQEALLETLEPEKMYVENIFREELDGREYINWYSVQGENPQELADSEHWLDKKHIEFWNECIDETYRPVDLKVEMTAIPEKIEKHMK